VRYAPIAKLVLLSKTSIADEMRAGTRSMRWMIRRETA